MPETPDTGEAPGQAQSVGGLDHLLILYGGWHLGPTGLVSGDHLPLNPGAPITVLRQLALESKAG